MSTWTHTGLDLYWRGVDDVARRTDPVLLQCALNPEGLLRIAQSHGKVGPGRQFPHALGWRREVCDKAMMQARAEVRRQFFDGEELHGPVPTADWFKLKNLLSAWQNEGWTRRGDPEALARLTRIINNLHGNKEARVLAGLMPGLAQWWKVKTPKVVLSYGMGWDSTAILLRWLTDPTSRDFDLDELVVITAMTGDEYEDTRHLVEKHIMPRLQDAGVRFVQVARAGASQTDGIVWLADSLIDNGLGRDRLFVEGAFKLSDELLASGTVPQAAGDRLCSIKEKGTVLDLAILQLVGRDQPFRHIIGFNADEQKRIVRDKSFSTAFRHAEHPLDQWGWGETRLKAFVRQVIGEEWAKSCCTFCPFLQGKTEALGRLARHPDEAVEALLIEHRSMALNPRQTLFAKGSLRKGLEAFPAVIQAWEQRLAGIEKWALYEVRRLWIQSEAKQAQVPPGFPDTWPKLDAHSDLQTLHEEAFGVPYKGKSREALVAKLARHLKLKKPSVQGWRAISVLRIGSKAEMLDQITVWAQRIGAESPKADGEFHRAWLERRLSRGDGAEHFLVVAPAGVKPKQRKGFEQRWKTRALRRIASSSDIARQLEVVQLRVKVSHLRREALTRGTSQSLRRVLDQLVSRLDQMEARR